MRELKAGDQCEHLSRVGSVHTGYRDERCTTTHLSRVDGKPQQLVIVREGRAHRKICTRRAPSAQIQMTRPKQKKPDHLAVQENLL